MFRLLLAAAPLLLASPTLIEAKAKDLVAPAELRRHIEVLASDAFEGRYPGSAGETKTLQYISTQWAALGLQPAGEGGSWYQQVGLMTRKSGPHRASWSVGGKPVAIGAGDVILIGATPQERIAGAPVYFAGHGLAAGAAPAGVKGAVAILLYAPADPDKPVSFSDRAKALREAGAAAVIAVFPDDVPWSAVAGSYSEGLTSLQATPVSRISGAMPMAAARSLVQAAGRTAEGGAALLPGLQVTMDVATSVNKFTSNNIVGRLRGSGKTGESVLYLGHWDHMGFCAPEGAKDRICNGAVDNASGIAMLIESARRLAKGPRPERDILFLGTTAEEMGLLGAEYFADRPVVPLNSIVAAVNVDTVAIHKKGEPVAVIGHGFEPLDAVIESTASELGRKMDTDKEADAFTHRQDGYKLAAKGVPAVMLGGSFSDMKQLQAFLSTAYHKPDDDLNRPIPLDGAAEDTDLMVALGRKLADPKVYQPPKR